MLPVLFRVFRVWLLLPLALLIPFAFVPELRRFDFAAVPTNIWLIIAGSLAGIIALYVLAQNSSLRAPRQLPARSLRRTSSLKFAVKIRGEFQGRDAADSIRFHRHHP